MSGCRHPRNGLLLVVIAAHLAVGCTPAYDPCFSPAALVRSTRILAIRADPPEAVVTSNGVPEVVVRVLVAGAGGPASAAAELTLCVPDSETCDPPLQGVADHGEASFRVLASRAFLDQSERADPLRGFGGVRLEVRVHLAGADEARKLLLYSNSTAPNLSIELGGVGATLDGHADSETNGAVVLRLGRTYRLRPLLTQGAEVYQTVDLSGHHLSLREHVTYDFFATSSVVFGSLPAGPRGVYAYYGVLAPDAAQADEPDGKAPTDGLVSATWVKSFWPSQSRPSQARDGDLAWIWVVARDGRGSVAWWTLPIRAEDRDSAAGDLFACPL